MSVNGLEEELLSLFARGVHAPVTEAEFNRLAPAVFRYQFERNRPYRHYCQVRGKTPETVCSWEEIPALPTSAFKEADLTTVPPEAVRVIYHTSGTSRGAEKRGRHLLPDTRLYDASLAPNFKAHLLPDRERMRILVCGPTARFFPHSSLGHMHSRVLDLFGATGSGVFWREDGPRFGCLASAVARAEQEGTAVCLLGTILGFTLLMEWLEEQGRVFRLPRGSRIMDTGGYKGQTREVPREELFTWYQERLGVSPDYVVNEYGMTELGSQFYDHSVRDVPDSAAQQPGSRASSGDRLMMAPPWVQVQVVDPETLAPLPEGKPGLLRHFDLANLHTVAAVQTDDLGVRVGDGFRLLGRATGAEPRGCSLAAEDFLRTQAA
jgi:acyl-CoA synthetase (AMP-forming)/AMP-acid ligase II